LPLWSQGPGVWGRVAVPPTNLPSQIYEATSMSEISEIMIFSLSAQGHVYRLTPGQVRPDPCKRNLGRAFSPAVSARGLYSGPI
ncbi:unnamed protein product, partial [Ectocarpus sp. 6 AP-2014]